MRRGLQKQDLKIVVEGAYHDDPELSDPVPLGGMGFLNLCANTYMRKPVAVKLLSAEARKDTLGAFLYSFKADPVTTSPL